MMHYATVPNSYDVALLLSGDKDYMPAMMRCRQKGRRVGLVSMRRGCNKALVESPSITDYDVIWLDDHVREFVKPKSKSCLSSSSARSAICALRAILSGSSSRCMWRARVAKAL